MIERNLAHVCEQFLIGTEAGTTGDVVDQPVSDVMPITLVIGSRVTETDD